MHYPSVASRRRRVVVQALCKGLAGTLIAFVLAESLLHVIYAVRNSMVSYAPAIYGFDYGPAPPWFDGLRILEADPVLIWKNRRRLTRHYIDLYRPVRRDEDRAALLQRFWPTLPEQWKANPVYETLLNSDGFRDREFVRPKPPSTIRVVCLGDSWTFGASVGQDRTYPRRLEARLRRAFPGVAFEVLNLGVVGYSSFQGLAVFEQFGLALEPDLVVVSYLNNDITIVGWRDKDLSVKPSADRHEVPAGVRRSLMERVEQRLTGWREHVESYKLLRYWAALATARPRALGEQLVGADPRGAASVRTGHDHAAESRVSLEGGSGG